MNKFFMLLSVIFVLFACHKENDNQKNGNTPFDDSVFCNFVEKEQFDSTMPIINGFLETLNPNLSDQEKVEKLRVWLIEKNCITDAKIICISCIETYPAQSELRVSFQVNELTKKN